MQLPPFELELADNNGSNNNTVYKVCSLVTHISYDVSNNCNVDVLNAMNSTLLVDIQIAYFKWVISLDKSFCFYHIKTIAGSAKIKLML